MLQHHPSSPLLQQPSCLSFEGVLDTKIHPVSPRHSLLWSSQLLSQRSPLQSKPVRFRASSHAILDSHPGGAPGSDPLPHTQVTWEPYCHLVAEARDAVHRESASLKTCHKPPVGKFCAPQTTRRASDLFLRQEAAWGSWRRSKSLLCYLLALGPVS